MSKLFTADFSQFKDMISYIREGLVSLGCDNQTLDTIHVICDEFITNIINNAYENEMAMPHDIDGNEYAKPLRLSYDKTPKQVSIELTDWGQPFNPLEYSGDAPGKQALGGFGIGIARNLADSIMYNRKDGRNILTCCIKTRNQE